MTSSTQQLLAALSNEQKSKISFKTNDAERFNWHFVPLNDSKTKSSTRKGVSLAEMNGAAKAALFEMLKTGCSPEGYKWCRDIMDRESILAELEPQNAWFRKPDWYFVTIYGNPSPTDAWGWRLDGHHLSASFAVSQGKIVSATPLFMGVNPVTIKHGARKGEHDTIAASEDLGRSLFLSLSDEQKSAAYLSKHLPEVAARTLRAPTNLPQGVSASTMNASQQKKLAELIGHYTGRMPAAFAKQEMDRVMSAGLEKITFAYSGKPEAGQRHTYNLQGPSFMVHYMNEQTDPHQNPANHIHSVYRSREGDFGGVKPV